MRPQLISIVAVAARTTSASSASPTVTATPQEAEGASQ
jgi:hypothetical protein